MLIITANDSNKNNKSYQMKQNNFNPMLSIQRVTKKNIILCDVLAISFFKNTSLNINAFS